MVQEVSYHQKISTIMGITQKVDHIVIIVSKIIITIMDIKNSRQIQEGVGIKIIATLTITIIIIIGPLELEKVVIWTQEIREIRGILKMQEGIVETQIIEPQEKINIQTIIITMVMITINMTTPIKINRKVMEIIIIKGIMNIHQVKCPIIGWINIQIILELQ